MSKKPVLLCIMDGYGMPEADEGNAIAAANKPNLDALFASCPYTTMPRLMPRLINTCASGSTR